MQPNKGGESITHTPMRGTRDDGEEVYVDDKRQEVVAVVEYYVE